MTDTEDHVDPFFKMMSMDDPIPELHALRESDPVHLVASGAFWLVTRHDDIKRLFSDPGHVTHDKRRWEFYVPPPDGSMRLWAENHGIFAVGDSEHDRLRRLVAAAFTPRAISRMEGQIRQVIEQIAEPLRDRRGEVIDVLGGFTNVVPNAVMSRITGVPPGEDEAMFCRIAQAVILGALPFTPEDVQAQAERGFREFVAMIRELVALRRTEPQEDLVTDLLRAQSEDDTLSEDDIVLLLASLIGAGSEATSQVATAVVRTLLNEPEVMERLREDRSLIRKALHELLRYGFSLPAGTMRFATRDFELRGRSIRKGQMLMLSGGGANRDPRVYEDPDVLDLERPANQLLTFGYGPHFCLGAHLAREEIATMVEVILDLLPPGSTICKDRLEFTDMGMFRQANNLPVAVGFSTTPAP